MLATHKRGRVKKSMLLFEVKTHTLCSWAAPHERRSVHGLLATHKRSLAKKQHVLCGTQGSNSSSHELAEELNTMPGPWPSGLLIGIVLLGVLSTKKWLS